MPERLLDIPTTAERLGGISDWTVRDLIRRGKLAHTPVGRRLMIPESAIDRFISANTVAAKERPAKRRKEASSPAQDGAGVTRLVDIRALCQ